jgi:D-alanyl-D-alanine carboxypeptidase
MKGLNAGKNVTVSIIIGALAITDAVGWYMYALAHTTAKKAQNEVVTKSLDYEAQIALIGEEKTKLEEALANEQAKVADLEKDNKRAEKKVDELEELSELDPELLKKYSRVYFLNENYTPERLSEIDSEYLLKADSKLQIHKEVERYLSRMMDAAEDDGIDLKVLSSYRSFKTQMALKDGYVVTYGAGTANQFSAEQGYSEHQLGTAVDLTTPAIGGAYVSFAKTEAYKWLLENAHSYGFILSYPEGNTYYQFEPWHWRFVGVDLARRLERRDMSFYEMDQRDIDDYLGDIFD